MHREARQQVVAYVGRRPRRTLIRLTRSPTSEAAPRLRCRVFDAVLHFIQPGRGLLPRGGILSRLQLRDLVGDLRTQGADLILRGGDLGRIGLRDRQLRLPI